MQFSGRGSMMNLHMLKGEIRNTSDTDKGDTELRDLFFYDLLEKNCFLARRGMINLSLVLKDEHVEQLIGIVAEFIETRRTLFRG